ncbi:methionine synthase activation domain-like protein [Rhizoclosmatium globosum]|uniref:Methionine synthase activation domain-like protein n=1 Tax=Rhizoclosmatium globosum TaxID=329046 RepID=A0A1Y2B407_9FUNG|nr:methionine synthase activation domain-like protein [Rhizoclosmatium globosum]|eukprot:ORY29464.1 methionine synthase activation domain-like protein [Rhizoclosmatium globosum]
MSLPQFLRRFSELKKNGKVQPSGAGTVLLATVNGDHYDMGKNLVASVLEAKGFFVVDLGVSVHADEIIKAVVEYNPDVIGLSGLIVPSLHQMVHTVKALSEIGIETPILIGGAATTKQNTIVNIAPHYSGPVLPVWMLLVLFGQEARKVMKEVLKVINEIIETKSLQARAIVWFSRANSHGDDIHILSPDGNTQTGTFYGLRQQQLKPNPTDPYYCISDFIAPAPIQDYIGGMVVSVGFGLEQLCMSAKNDPYRVHLYKSAAECLTGALAEKVHDQVKYVFWNPSTPPITSSTLSLELGEHTSSDLREGTGIRLAPCFPQQPDHTEMETMWRVMDVERMTGIKLTETLGMDPVMAVNGLLFSHPKAECFAVGPIADDQVCDYAERRGVAKKLLKDGLL